MAGLLDFFQQDPEKQAALKQGLLNMGIQMMAGGPQDFGTSLGHGMGAGVSVYQKQLDDLKKKQAMQNVFRSAYGQPPAQSPQAPLGIAAKPPAQEAAAPTAPMYGGKAPLLSMEYAGGSDFAQAQPQSQPQQAPEPQAPAPQFDRNAFVRAAFENPEAGYADTAMKYMLDPSLNKGPESMFGKIMPNAYTPASLAKYQQSNNFADLVPVAGGSNFGNVNPGQFTPDSLARYSQSGDYADLVPRSAPQKVDSGKSVDIIDTSTGRVISSTPKQLAPQDQPYVKAAQATAETTARETAKLATEKVASQQKAAADLPKIRDSSNFARKMVEGVLHHPALSSSVGFTWTPGAQYIPGTPQADFKARLDQLKGSAFLEAFNTLRGGGSITEVEGGKAESSINRMSTATSEAEFNAAANDFLEVLNASERRAINAAGGSVDKPAQPKQVSGTYKDPYTVTNEADYNSVPKGKYYKAPDGSIRMRK